MCTHTDNGIERAKLRERVGFIFVTICFQTAEKVLGRLKLWWNRSRHSQTCFLQAKRVLKCFLKLSGMGEIRSVLQYLLRASSFINDPRLPALPGGCSLLRKARAGSWFPYFPVSLLLAFSFINYLELFQVLPLQTLTWSRSALHTVIMCSHSPSEGLCPLQTWILLEFL